MNEPDLTADRGGLLTLPEPAERQPAPGGVTPIRHSGFVRLLGFRLIFCYFVLYNLPIPLDAIPGLDTIAEGYEALWHRLVPLVGSLVLRLSQPVAYAVSGSGDTMYDYVRNFTILLLALFATLVWTAFDRRREHTRLREWLRLYVRICLGATAIAYGSYKVIKSQFPAPTLDQLLQPVGDSSPMNLLWTFMGFSTAYNFFTGAGELVGGVLLFFRRTTLAGSLLLIAVMSNVVILNYAYDVPVKIYSTNLLLMAVWLAAYDSKRLVDFFVLNRVTAPAPDAPLFATKRKQYTLEIVVKGLCLVALVGTLVKSYQGRASFGDRAPRSALYGLYDTMEFTRNGQLLPPLESDSARWKRITFPSGRFAIVRLADGAPRYFTTGLDTAKHTVTLTGRDTTRHFVLSYDWPEPGQLRLVGFFRGDSIRATFNRRDESSFLLMNRGYHWIQEQPFNR